MNAAGSELPTLSSDSPAPRPACAWGIILAAGVVYFAVTLIALDRHSFESDEIIYSMSARSLVQRGVFSWDAFRLTNFDTSQTMIDVCVLAEVPSIPAIALFGYSFYAVKATAIAAGALALLGVAIAARKLTGHWYYAGLSLMMLAGSFLFQTCCRLNRPHLMVGVLLPWTLLLIVRGLIGDSRKQLFAAGVLGAALGLSYTPAGFLPFFLVLSFAPVRSGAKEAGIFILTRIGPLLLGYGLIGAVYGLVVLETMGATRFLDWIHIRSVFVNMTYKPSSLHRYFHSLLTVLPPHDLALLAPFAFVLIWLWRFSPSPKPHSARILARALFINFFLLAIVWPRKGFHEVAISLLIPAALLFASLAKHLPLAAVRRSFPGNAAWAGIFLFLLLNGGVAAYKLSVKFPQAGYYQMVQAPLRELLASPALPRKTDYPIYGPNLLLPAIPERNFYAKDTLKLDQALTGTPMLELFIKAAPAVWVDSLDGVGAAAPTVDAAGHPQKAKLTYLELRPISDYCQAHARFLGAIPCRLYNRDRLLRVYWLAPEKGAP